MPKANSTHVQKDRQQWSPGASDATSIANCRVSLALLKLHRTVSIAPGDADAAEVITALWPVIHINKLIGQIHKLELTAMRTQRRNQL